MVLILLLLAALIAGAVYFFFIKPDKKEETKPPSTSSTKPEPDKKPAENPFPTPQPDTAVDLATLTMVRINAPSEMSAYDLIGSGETFSRYTSKAKNTCELGFGVLSGTDLPGDNLNAIIDAQMRALRESGATITGPTAGTILELANNSDTSKKYSLPTLQFEVSKDNLRAKSHYSAVVLKGGNRAVVNRTCYTTDDSEVADSDIAGLDATAKLLTITPQ